MNDFRSVYLPYCFKKTSDEKYLVLNRRYKPVGFNTTEHIKYEDFPVATSFRITKVTAQKLSWEDSEDTNDIFLYNDGCIPTGSAKNMKEYLEKIELLSKLKCKTR